MGQSISSPVPVFAKECTDLHKKYDDCFKEWYDNSFLKGTSIENPCLDHWTEYMECVNVALIKNNIRKLESFSPDELPDNISDILKNHIQNNTESKK